MRSLKCGLLAVAALLATAACDQGGINLGSATSSPASHTRVAASTTAVPSYTSPSVPASSPSPDYSAASSACAKADQLVGAFASNQTKDTFNAALNGMSGIYADLPSDPLSAAVARAGANFNSDWIKLGIYFLTDSDFPTDQAEGLIGDFASLTNACAGVGYGVRTVIDLPQEPTAAPTTTEPATTVPPAAPKVVFSTSGKDGKLAGPFTITGDTWDVKYTYDCTGFLGGSGNFILDVEDGNGQPRLDGGLVNVLNDKGSGDAETSGNGKNIYLQVITECSWTLKVTDHMDGLAGD